MTILYKIEYKVVEAGKTYKGIRVGSETMEQYAEKVRRQYFDFDLFHLELIDTIEQVHRSASLSSSVIIIP